MKKILLISILAIISLNLSAQCECTDCDVFIPSLAPVSSLLDISGSTNDILGQGGQELCAVCIEMIHDAVIEIDMVLVAPDGSSVDLILNQGLSFNENILFEICFTPCSQTADPDAGFPATFDSAAGYVPNSTYDGTYYPANGCLEDLTGSVNGEWELQMEDFVVIMEGTLFDWYLVFADDTGLNCANADECSIEIACLAEGGEFNAGPFAFCEGDPNLLIDEDPSFPGGNEPPASEYDYDYIIVNTDTDVIENIGPTADLTALPAGNYQVCGLSFLIADETLIPSADGSLTIDDIQDDIDNEDYCADLSDNCIDVTIDTPPPTPDFVGPATACPGELVIYEVLNYDPNFVYQFSLTGSFNQFVEVSPGVLEVIWISGPGEICAIIFSSCGDVEVCVTTDVVGSEEIEITGNIDPCPGEIVTYTVEPIPSGGESYNFSTTGGTIINQTSNTFDVEWPDVEGSFEICADLVGGACVIEPECEDIDVELDYELPSTLDSPDELCDQDIGTSMIPDDADILSFTWTSTNLNILSGEGTNEVTYEGQSFGLAEICLEIETACGPQGPICETIDILETPDPQIQDITPTCEFTITLESTADNNNDIEWTQESGPGGSDIIDDDQAITSVELVQAGEYTFQITESNGDCVSTATVTVEILEELEVSDPIFECNLDNEYTATIEITSGEGPYTVNGESISGTEFTSELTPSEEAIEFTVIDNIGCSTTFEVEFECPCVSDAGTMSGSTLFICIEETEFFQADFDDNATLDNNDVGLFYLHDGDDDELGFVFDFNTTGEFEYSDEYALGVPYYISYVVGNDLGGEIDLDDECLSVAQGQEVIFLGTEPIQLMFNETVCGNVITIEGELADNIIGINWTQVDGTGSSEFSNDESIPTEITVSTSGSYSYEIEIENEACIYFQEIDIEFSNGPEISNVVENCDGSGSTYQVSFEMQGSEPFDSQDGQITNGNIFTSDPIPTGEPYSLTVTDANDCEQVITGNKLCDCLSDAGLLTGQSTTLCVNDSVTVSVSDFNLDTDDNGIFVLHDGALNNLGNILSFNTDGVFTYDMSFDFDSTYFINFIVANATEDSIDLTDVCLDLSNGIEVSWLDFPEVEAGLDQASCDGLFILNAFPEQGSWMIVESPMGSSPNISNSISFNSELVTDVPGRYVLEWTTNNGACESSDQVIIDYYPTPEVTNVNTFCLDNQDQYVLSFDLINANGPYTVDGTLLMEDEFASSFLDVNAITTFEIISGDGCITEFTFGPVDCSCDSEIGTFVDAEFRLCDFETLNPNISNNDFIALPGQILSYVLHDGDADNIGNILATSQGVDIPYAQTFNLGQTYFLTPVLSVLINDEVDFDDNCIQFGTGVPVTWIESYEVLINESISVCSGDEVLWIPNLDGPYPLELIFETNDGEQYQFELQDRTEVLNFGILNSETRLNLLVAVGECIFNFEGGVDVQIIEEPEVNLLQGVEVCNNEDFGSTVLLFDIVPDNVLGDWNLNGIPLENGTLNFDGFAEGIYTLDFSTEGFYPPCPGQIYTTEIIVNECICPSFTNTALNLCDTDGPVILSNFDTGAFQGTWSIETQSGTQEMPSIIANEIRIDQADEGNYLIVYTIDDPSYPDNCDPRIIIELAIENAIDLGQVSSPLNICANEVLSIDLFDLIDGGDNNGNWFLNGEAVSNTIESNILEPGDNVFEYTVDDSSLCEGGTISNIITVNTPPTFSVNADDVLCFGEDNGEIEIVIEDVNGNTVNCYLNDILQEEGKLISGLSPGVYEIYIENENCVSEMQLVEISEPEPVTVSLGDDREIGIEEEVTIQAITNILDSDIDGISWSDLSEILQIDVLELRSTFNQNNIIQIEITDINGCVALDQIQINVIFEDIYIPNVMSLSTQDSNSEFRIQNLNANIVSVESFRVFDRWGNKVYELENISPENFDNLVWDGFFDGAPAEQGVYVYSIILNEVSGARRIFAGDVTLIR